MPWNNGGPDNGPSGKGPQGKDPWGEKPGETGKDGAKARPENEPVRGPWGEPKQADPGPQRPSGPRPPGGGPFGSGGGPFGSGGPSPDLDRLIEQVQASLRGLLGGGGGRGRPPNGGSGGPGSPFARATGGRGLTLILLGIVVIWLGSGFYRVQPDEQGVVMRFGAYAYWTPPGLHWHLPWPVETVSQPTVTRINRTEIGFRSAGGTTGGIMESGRDTQGRDVLAESLMLTGDENIIDIDITVFWRITDAAAFLFNTANPQVLVRAVAESSLREVIGRTPIQPALTQLRAQIEADVHRQAQEILDRYKAGVEVTQVQLQKVDPPGAVIESFRDVQRANTDADRMRNEAESYRNDIVPRARGDAARIVAEGQGTKASAVAQATGQTQRFDNVLRAYQQAKEVTVRRMYLDTMEDVLLHAQPLVVDDKLKGLVPFLPLNVPPPQPKAVAPPASSAAPSATLPGAAR
jgi:membrane protease subunit HflK